MPRVWSALLLSVVLSSTTTCATDPDSRSFAPVPEFVDADTTVAFVDVRVVPMDRPQVLNGYTVVVRDGRIAEMGPAGEITVPSDAVVIDGDGRYLMPGLADMHVHMLHQEDMLLYLANGVTTVRNMWGTLSILRWRDQVNAGVLLGPRIYSASRGLDGTPPFWPTTIVVDDPAAGRQAVRDEAAMGFDFIKVYNNLTTPVYDAIMDEASVVGIPVVGHVPGRVGLSHALSRGQKSIEHLTGYQVGLGADVEAQARATRDAGTWMSPTLIVLISFVNLEDGARLERRPEMRYVHPAIKARWGGAPGRPSQDEQRAASRERGRVVRAHVEGGGGLLLGTDAWISYVIPGYSIHDELRLLVEDAGLTPYEAIRAGTADAARFLGAEGEFGTIAPGRAADFILVRANPLSDVANVAKRAGVMVHGTWISQEELTRRLEEQAQRFASGQGGDEEGPDS